MRKGVKTYLMKSKNWGITPNFFMSEPYLALCDARLIKKDGWMWLVDGEWCLFPPLPITNSKDTIVPPPMNVWALFEEDRPINEHYKFLDWQYVFDPKDFLNMSGKVWETFRKNSRKWPRRNLEWRYSNEVPDHGEACELIAQWLESKVNTVLDGELLAEFTHFNKDLPISRKYLYNKEGRLMAINAWDVNWKYINYRVCMVREGEPFLDEFVRWLFYTDADIVKVNKLVNDGGTLGCAGLERFKDKMNPTKKIKIYSWIK